MTHNNPNVHVELGIALFENKNVFRVTGRSLTELGFDIRNLEVRRYSSEKDLLKKLIDYLDIFFEIKRLPISRKFPELYRTETTLKLEAAERGKADIRRGSDGKFLVRDGAVRATFEFRKTLSPDPDNWFGIYFRAAALTPLLGSYLAYVRQNGSVEVAIYPGARVFKQFPSLRPISGRKTMLVEFENNHLEIRIGNARFPTDELAIQNVGNIFFAAWQADVDVIAAEMICRDTIDFDESSPLRV